MNYKKLKNYIIPTRFRELDSPYLNANPKGKSNFNTPEFCFLKKQNKKKKKSLVLQKSGESIPKKITQKIKKEFKKSNIQIL